MVDVTMRFVSIVLLLCAGICAAPAFAQAKPTIAVLPLRVEGLQLNEIQRINVQMRARASSRGGYDVQAEGDTTQLVEASQSLGLDCDVNAIECGVRVGQIADVAYVLVGRATGGLDGHVGIDASLIDVKAGGAVRRVSALLPADVARQSEAMNAFAESLFAKPDAAGNIVGAPLVSLTLQVEPGGAEIFVDGAKRGLSPLTVAVDSLMPGDHYVVVTKPGFIAYRSRLSVLTGEAATLQITLAVDPNAMRKTPTGLEAAAPWITAGVGAAAVIGGGVASGVAASRFLAFEEAVRNIEAVDIANELDQSELDTIREQHENAEDAAADWESWGQPTFVGGLVAVGIGLVVTAGGIVWGVVQMEDVEGASDDGAPATAPSSPAPSPAAPAAR
jgi:hypothetical protein